MTTPPAPPDQSRRDTMRVTALSFAQQAIGPGSHQPTQYTRLADPFYAWLIATETAQISWVARVTGPDGTIKQTLTSEVNKVTTPTPTTPTVVEMTAADTLDFAAKTADAEGKRPTPDQLWRWSG